MVNVSVGSPSGRRRPRETEVRNANFASAEPFLTLLRGEVRVTLHFDKASCQVYCLAFEEELTVPPKYLSLFITP